jgi:hypothetical protein
MNCVWSVMVLGFSSASGLVGLLTSARPGGDARPPGDLLVAHDLVAVGLGAGDRREVALAALGGVRNEPEQPQERARDDRVHEPPEEVRPPASARAARRAKYERAAIHRVLRGGRLWRAE